MFRGSLAEYNTLSIGRSRFITSCCDPRTHVAFRGILFLVGEAQGRGGKRVKLHPGDAVGLKVTRPVEVELTSHANFSALHCDHIANVVSVFTTPFCAFSDAVNNNT